MYYVVIALNIRMPYDFRKATSLLRLKIACMYLPNLFISTARLTMRPEYYRSIFLHVKI